MGQFQFGRMEGGGGCAAMLLNWTLRNGGDGELRVMCILTHTHNMSMSIRNLRM